MIVGCIVTSVLVSGSTDADFVEYLILWPWFFGWLSETPSHDADLGQTADPRFWLSAFPKNLNFGMYFYYV